MMFLIIAILCVAAFFINSMINSARINLAKKSNPNFQTTNEVLAEWHPIFNIVSALVIFICPLAILIIAINNVITLL